jgi:two-component system, cell cycle sensor histidine kinase and response regulator CckA
VITATDGAEAVVLFARRGHEVALVLTDIMMPIMDGPATIRALLRMDPQVKIVAASGLGTAGGASAAESYGVQEFITKPYNAQTLLEVVGRVLAGRPRGTPRQA